MKNLTAQAVYNADIYLRLSDDDGDKPESNSIKNQREFITEFLKSMPEIRIHAERKDDGFSGVDFFRPGIQEVLQDVRSGAVNCVVVKDLSRLGRNYIETGKVLQEFAGHGVRFIAINDGYDTANAQGQASTILLPIKNLMKTGRPNYKIKKLMEKPEDEWIRVPGTHEPIISEVDFRTVSGLLRRDTRIAVQKKTVYPFSGLLFCADCKQNMIRKTVPAGGKKYYYYSCSTNRADKSACTTHNISEALLMDAVRDCIHAHMETVLNIEKTLQFIAALPAEDTEARKIDRQLEKLKADYEQAMRFKMSAYEKFVDHLLNEDEFKQYQRIYTEKCEAIAAAISKRQEELDAIVQAGSPQGEWIAHFKSFRHVDVMERKILVKIIDRIYVYEGNRIEIIFKYQNEYRAAATYIEQYMERQATQAAPTVKEAV